MSTYDKEKLLENKEFIEDIEHKIWICEQQFDGRYEIVEDRRRDFIEALSLILNTTSGVFDERDIAEIDIDPDDEEVLIEVTIDIFEVGENNIAKLSKVVSSVNSISIKTAEDSDEDDPFITICIGMKNFWRNLLEK